MKHIDIIIPEIRHASGKDDTCTCHSSSINSSIKEMVESIGITNTRVALSIATHEVFPREMTADGEVLSRKCLPISRRKLAHVLEEMKKERLMTE